MRSVRKYEPIVIGDVIRREFGDLLVPAEVIQEWRHVTYGVAFDLGDIARLRGVSPTEPSEERSALDIVSRMLAEWGLSMQNAGRSLQEPRAFERWTDAWVRVAALLKDLTVVGIQAETGAERVISPASAEKLLYDVFRLSERLQWLNPVFAPWIPFRGAVEAMRALDERVREARLPQPPANGVSWAEWQKQVLGSAEYRG